MSDRVRDIMTPDPLMVEADATLVHAAQLMRQRDVGDVLVSEQERVCGVLTDRDIVVRAIAAGMDPGKTTTAEICSRDLVAVSPDDSLSEAVELVRGRAVRRLPVVEDGLPVGILSLGDLAKDLDPRSALAEISASAPNR